MKTIRKRRVGKLTVRITAGSNDTVGIGDRWDAQVDGKVTVLASSPKLGLFVGTSKGTVSRLETATGRQCGSAELDGPIVAIAIDGRFVVVATADSSTQLLSGSLKPPKPGKRR